MMQVVLLKSWYDCHIYPRTNDSLLFVFIFVKAHEQAVRTALYLTLLFSFGGESNLEEIYVSTFYPIFVLLLPEKLEITFLLHSKFAIVLAGREVGRFLPRS